MLSFEKKKFHSKCLRCSVKDCLNPKLKVGNAQHELKKGVLTLYCQKCWNALGKNRPNVGGKDDQKKEDDQKQEDDSQVVKEVEGDKEVEKEKEEAPRTELD